MTLFNKAAFLETVIANAKKSLVTLNKFNNYTRKNTKKSNKK